MGTLGYKYILYGYVEPLGMVWLQHWQAAHIAVGLCACIYNHVQQHMKTPPTCVCIYIYTHIHIHLHIIYINVQIHIYINVSTYMYVNVH